MTTNQGPDPLLTRWLERVALFVTEWVGSSVAFALALGSVLVWAVSGPWFHFSDTWQLAINTSTTIVTFLMVFLIQRSQNKDARALHMKVNELLAGLEGASNRMINIEDLTEAEVRLLHDRYQRLCEIAEQEPGHTRSMSIEETVARRTDG